MKNKKHLIAPLIMLFLLVAVAFPYALHAQSNVPKATSLKTSPFAVVELFTSEGCSSCPPADKMLADLEDLAQYDNLPIYALGFHVDYWNSLGWVDSFSNPSYTQRQRLYALKNKADTIYTPQFIVNGDAHYEGFHINLVQDTIKKALRQPAKSTISLSVSGAVPQLTIKFSVRAAPETAYLHIALVEKDLTTYVKKGENAGRTLHHENVVRMFKSYRLEKSKGSVTINISPENDLKKFSVIAYLQDMNDMSIVGANRIPLNP